MNKDQRSYREIFKATSLFGGVQFINILIAVARSKIVAVLLGPTGMGISGLYYSSTDFILRLTSFGLGTSAVKNVAEAASTDDENRVSIIVSVLRKLVWVTGLIGLSFTAIFSSWLSQITFGNKEFTYGFIWISITLLFKQLTSGQLVILQGLRKLKYLASANLFGSIVGLIIVIPLYYFFGIDGIVPAIILISLTALLLSFFYSQKVKVKSVKITRQQTFTEGREMLRMGFLLSLSGLITVGASYILRIFISQNGGVDDVGLYNAGFAIINTYVGMVFTAMGTDYYPRLSSVAHDNDKASQMMNQQAEIAILILSPILTVFFVFINWVILILYSEKFLAINDMVHWAALGMYFKAVSWSIAYVLLAKGAAKLFFWNELVSNLILLSLNIIGYHFAGLEGLGISFLVGYFLYLLQVFLVARFNYGFRFSLVFIKVSSIQILVGFTVFIIVRILDSPIDYILGSLLILISTAYSLIELNKRLNILQIARDFVRRFKKRKR